MRVNWWELTDDVLIRQCDVDHYRASGPGGQHRNKTESAVRLRHKPTGVLVTGEERRSQHENRAQALKRLREALAFQFRQPLVDQELPIEIVELCRSGRLDLGRKTPQFLPAASYILDLLTLQLGRTSDTAARLGISTGNLVKFLRTEDGLWQAAQRIRQANQLPLLR